MSTPTIARERFEAALEKLIQQVKTDRNILAAILCGSLAHDEVWDKSDIDLVLICKDDNKTNNHGISLTEDDINIHTQVQQRGEFKRRVEGAARNSFEHSLYAKSRLLFSNDPSIEQLFTELQSIGARDTQLQLMRAGTEALISLYKAQKWYHVRQDLDLSALWILYTATPLAAIEVGRHGEIIAREVIPDAQRLNPCFFDLIYSDLLNRKKTAKAVGGALAAIDEYLQSKVELLFQPILDYLADCGEPRSATEIGHHFQRNFNLPHAVIACEWLADIEVIDKLSNPTKLTNTSQIEVPELAFFYTGEDFGQ
jgi:predicted nucleotidyltransferase|tara:strand:+ start:411 stop:1346 length:936 start_codon:yes stop_codon:yes gene_type:complete